MVWNWHDLWIWHDHVEWASKTSLSSRGLFIIPSLFRRLPALRALIFCFIIRKIRQQNPRFFSHYWFENQDCIEPSEAIWTDFFFWIVLLYRTTPLSSRSSRHYNRKIDHNQTSDCMDEDFAKGSWYFKSSSTESSSHAAVGSLPPDVSASNRAEKAIENSDGHPTSWGLKNCYHFLQRTSTPIHKNWNFFNSWSLMKLTLFKLKHYLNSPPMSRTGSKFPSHTDTTDRSQNRMDVGKI